MAGETLRCFARTHVPGSTTWMDKDNDLTRWSGRPHFSVDPAARIQHIRASYNDHVRHLFPGPSHRRLVTYVIRPPGADASAMQSRLRELAEEHGCRVVYDFTDTAAYDLDRREGYAKALRMIYGGRADGLVVPDMATLTADYAQYEQAVRWLGERNALLIPLIPETQL